MKFGGGQVSGTGACNQYSSSYTIVDGKLEIIDGFLSTAMGCDDLEFESQFLALLSTCSVIELGGETLTLSDGAAKNRLSFLPEVVFRLPLVGTSWSCTGLQTTSADTVEMTMTGDRLSVRFDADGAVSGSIDCNTFVGKAKISDGAIEVGALEVTEEGCNPAPLGQDVDVLKWLTAADSYKIRDKQLQLIDSESGNRLIFEGALASPAGP